MYTHVLIPTDGSELSQAGVIHGLSLAKEHGARVTAMTATEVPGGQFAYSSDLSLSRESCSSVRILLVSGWGPVR